jgi:hypothetical protein
MLLVRPRRRRSVEGEPPRKTSKRLKKVPTGCSIATPSMPRDSLSVTDFDKSQCGIMYPHFVDSELVAPSEHTDD